MSGFDLRWIVLILALPVAAAHAGTEAAADGLRRCSRETDEHQRLACFDALAAALPQIKNDQFGMTAEIAHRRDPAVEYDHSDVLAGKINGLQEVTSGQWIFTLDNGQLWIQTEPKPGMRFSVGETVQIEHGAMGSLWLAADHRRKTRVKRIQ
jgi:hypothetical protein